jgi:ankyrin repeat protein
MSGKKWLTILSIFDVKDVFEHREIMDSIDSGLDINIADSGGRTMLMEAVIRKDIPLVDALVKRGADVNRIDKRRWTALHFAAQNNDPTIGLKLILSGADVNATDDYGNNVVWRAVFECRKDYQLVRTLLDRGANPYEKNMKGISAKDLVNTFGDVELAGLFMD